MEVKSCGQQAHIRRERYGESILDIAFGNTC